MVALLLAGVDQLPILACLEHHLAQQRFLALELAANDLSEEVDLGDEVCFGLEVLQFLEGRQLGVHLFKYNLNRRSDNLEEKLGVEQLDLGLLNVDDSRGLCDHPLGGDALAGLVGLGLLLVVVLDAVEEVDPGGGELEVLDADVDALGDDALADLLVDDDSDGSGVDVEDGAGAAVVVLVGHSLVDGAVDDDINDVSDLEAGERVGDVDGSVLLEPLSELVSGSSLVSVTVGHLWSKIINII